MEGPSPRRQPGLCWQENVTLADILSLRDSGLSEQEAWAVCLECSLAMRSVAHAAIFQTLCITPDTLAFNTSGNVCFMEQLSGEAWAPARSPGFWGGGQAGSAASGGGGLPPTPRRALMLQLPPRGRRHPILPLRTHLPTLARKAAVSFLQGPGQGRGRRQSQAPESSGLGSVPMPPALLPYAPPPRPAGLAGI